MNKELLIVFVKNIKLGKVKTRLAKTIGDQGAFEIYKELFKITETITTNLPVEKRIYFSDVVIDYKWPNTFKTVQQGADLGERMKNAFMDGFADGYEKIVLIGSDLPEISETIIRDGFKQLSQNELVFGPADDGGYYLIGQTKMNLGVFENKPWSQSHLLETTLEELTTKNAKFSLLQSLNDIDTFEDLIASDFYKRNLHIQKMTKQIVNQ